MNASFRLKFYKELLKIVCKDPLTKTGYCYYLSHTWKALGNRSTFPRIWEFKELMHYQPNRYVNFLFWFPCTPSGWNKRIAILEEIIANMKEDVHYYSKH